MSRIGVCAALALAALALPASAWAGHVRTPECPQELCAGIAADGSGVVFPFAEELTPGAGGPEVYRWSSGRLRALVPIPKGTLRRAAIGLDGASADLRHVFVETILGLAPEDTDGGAPDIYDVGGAAPALLSTGPLDAASGGTSFSSFAGASADGSRVFARSQAPLVAGDVSSCGSVYERANGVTTLVAVGPSPPPPVPPSRCYMESFDGISADGSHIFFSTQVDLLGEGRQGTDIYQRAGGALSVLTTYPDPPHNCVDIPKFGASSADGGTVLFSTNSPISAEDTDEASDVYKREPDGSFVLVSKGTDGGAGCGFGGDRPVALSADGRIAIFETRARLSPADTDSSNDLYRAEDGQAPMLISTGPTDPSADEQAKVFPDWVAAASADARTVAFETAQALVAEDHDASMDVYVNVNGVTELASTGPQQGGAASAAELLGLSGDGQTVVFATKGRLTASDLDRGRDIYVRRLGSQRTVLLSGEEIPPSMLLSPRGTVRASGPARVRLACPKTEASGPCHGTVTLSRGKRRLGRGAFNIAPGRRGQVPVRLRRAFSPTHSFRALARVIGADRLGNSAVTTGAVRITLRGKAR